MQGKDTEHLCEVQNLLRNHDLFKDANKTKNPAKNKKQKN
jgi:hypothetical protein